MNTRHLLFTILLTLTAFVFVSCSNQTDDEEQPAPAQNQQSQQATDTSPPSAPAFTLMDQNGQPVKLADHQDKIVVLEWTNPECPFVLRHYNNDNIPDLAAEYQHKGVVWLAVNSTKHLTQEDNKKWHDQHNLTYPVLDDHTGDVGRAYQAKTTPHIFIIDKSGRIAYQGAIDNDPQGQKPPAETVNYVAQALDALLAGNDPPQQQNQPYGCSVKYAAQ